MKKITLTIGLFLLGLSAMAQQINSTNSVTTKERSQEYIIVLDDTQVEGNIHMLLNDSEILCGSESRIAGHELSHSTLEVSNLQDKFIQTAYSFNEIAMNSERSGYGTR